MKKIIPITKKPNIKDSAQEVAIASLVMEEVNKVVVPLREELYLLRQEVNKLKQEANTRNTILENIMHGALQNLPLNALYDIHQNPQIDRYTDIYNMLSDTSEEEEIPF